MAALCPEQYKISQLGALCSLEQKEKKAQQKEAEKVQREREATVRAAGLSQKLMERLKARRFAQIFQYLDQV